MLLLSELHAREVGSKLGTAGACGALVCQYSRAYRALLRCSAPGDWGLL